MCYYLLYMKKYFFILGNHPDLSWAELKSLFPENGWEKHGSVAFSNFSQDINIDKLMKELGGTIKIGEIIKEISIANRQGLSKIIKKEILAQAQKSSNEKRFNFGFSLYQEKKIPGNFFKLGLAIKKDLEKINISSRLVSSQESNLSSVIVEQNNLLTSSGLELCLISNKSKVFLGKTLAVQDFKGLGQRDFGRPQRDDHSGMIPPKLAQIMLNLARGNDADYQEKILLDPFCGSGTILMEAHLMGFKNIIGSDLSEKAIIDSQKNIAWLDENNDIKMMPSDVLKLEQEISEKSIDYIVCEPYLGPQRGYKDFNEIVSELNDFYSDFLKVLFKLLKKDGKLVMVWPQFKANDSTWKINPNVGNFLIGDKSFLYGRTGQKVWREIIILSKKNGV